MLTLGVLNQHIVCIPGSGDRVIRLGLPDDPTCPPSNLDNVPISKGIIIPLLVLSTLK